MEFNEILKVLDNCVGAVLSGLQGCKQDTKGNIRVRHAPWDLGNGYMDLPMVEILGNENGVRGFYMVPSMDGVPTAAVTHLLCAKLYMAGFVAADKQYQNQNSDSKSLLMIMPASKEADSAPKPPGTLRTYALHWFEQAHRALKGMSTKDSSCIYLMRYCHGSDYTYQERLTAVADSSIVYECDIEDSPCYTSAEIVNAIKAMVLDSDNMRIQKVTADVRHFGIPSSKIDKLYLIEWMH